MSDRFLLIQIREGREVRDHEYHCLLKIGGLSIGELDRHDLTVGPVDSVRLDELSGVIIGGSGEYAGQDDYPNRESLCRLVVRAERMGLPVLGICFGAQAVAEALGGRSVEDREHGEVGTFTWHRMPAAIGDPLFSACRERFLANEGHHSRVVDLPAGAVTLIESELCPVQVFRSAGGSVYGVQFHPELDRVGMLWRLDRYGGSYGEIDDKKPDSGSQIGDAPETVRLLRAWLKLAVSRRSPST